MKNKQPKNRQPYFLLLTLLSAMLFLLNGCSSTLLVENWSDKNYSGPPMKKILIIGVINNEKHRRSFENEFTSLLTTDKRTGIASHTLLPDLKKSGNKEKVLATVKEVGADAVMIVTSHGVVDQQRVTAPSVDYVPNAGMGYSSGMYGYYNTSHSVIFSPGHTVTDTILRVDIKLFSVATEKVIWSGKTESLNPKSAKKLIAEFERLVVRDMRKGGFIE